MIAITPAELRRRRAPQQPAVRRCSHCGPTSNKFLPVGKVCYPCKTEQARRLRATKGLTDRGLALPEIGQIRKGAKKDPNANRPGADLPYFRVEFDENERKTAEAFRAVYHDQPAMIRIILPLNETERMWDAWYEAYTAGRMIARSDGEYITYQLDDKSDIIVHNGMDKNGNKVKHPADGIAGYDFKNRPVKFKATGRLKVIIPELSRAAYLTVMTTSIHDIGNISDQLAAFKELNGGQLAGIPFILRRRNKMISTPAENGTRVRRAKSLISIEADPEWVKAKLTQLGSLALPNFEQALLPASSIDSEPVELDDDDIEGETEDLGEISQPEAVKPAPPENINQETGEAQEAIELIDPMNSVWVGYAAKAWNVSDAESAKQIASKNLGKRIDKRDFMKIVSG